MGETNAPEASGPVCTVFSLSGRNLGGFGPARRGKLADYSFDLPAGSYVLVFDEPCALRKVVRVEYQASAPRYDFNLSYGDVDENGRVDDHDILWIKRWLGITAKNLKEWEGLTGTADDILNSIPPSRADFNGDLVIDKEDLVMAIQSIGKRPDPLPKSAVQAETGPRNPTTKR